MGDKVEEGGWSRGRVGGVCVGMAKVTPEHKGTPISLSPAEAYNSARRRYMSHVMSDAAIAGDTPSRVEVEVDGAELTWQQVSQVQQGWSLVADRLGGLGDAGVRFQYLQVYARRRSWELSRAIKEKRRVLIAGPDVPARRPDWLKQYIVLLPISGLP
jgi:hypothetical protein